MLLEFFNCLLFPNQNGSRNNFSLFMVLQNFYLLLFLLMRESALVVGAPATTSSE